MTFRVNYMKEIILNDDGHNRKLFNINDGDILVWTEYKMKDKWYFDEEMPITAEEFGIIFDAIFGK